jgi:hypothetical protein
MINSWARILVILGCTLLVLGEEKWVNYLCDIDTDCSGQCQVEANSKGAFRSLKPVEDCLWKLSG